MASFFCKSFGQYLDLYILIVRSSTIFDYLIKWYKENGQGTTFGATSCLTVPNQVELSSLI
jgi:hypothetical protein